MYLEKSGVTVHVQTFKLKLRSVYVMLHCDSCLWSLELTIRVAVGAGAPAVIADITSAVRAAALLAVTARVPPLQPAVLLLLHLTADV